MNNDIKSLYEITFLSNFNTFLTSFESGAAAEKAIMMAEMIVKKEVDRKTLDAWKIEMYAKHNIHFVIQKPVIMREEKAEEWFTEKELAGSFYWNRYKQYLLVKKKWGTEAVQSINSSTNEILKSLGNPNNQNPFDKRGLVLGYVQSGKTANFTGLINKSFDLGYKLIIVLSGMHNDLRAQTQIRLEEEVTGSYLDSDKKPKGVSQIRPNDSEHIITTWTTIEQDISTNSTGTVKNLTNPTLMVIKKNKDVLEALYNQLTYLKSIVNINVPMLIIDDEADQASVDTSNPDKNEDPKTINKMIRKLLSLFERKGYVGYTATPFANLLINADKESADEGKDLYPKDFVIGLEKPADYCGPEEFFNVYEDEENERPSLIRYLSEEEKELFDSIKRKTDAIKINSVPPMMKEAILAFLIVIAIRNKRGQRNKHNSMLIHTSRFKDVQSAMKEEIDGAFAEIMNDVQFSPASETVKQLSKLYQEDFVKTSLNWDGKPETFGWEEIYEEIKNIIDKIEVMEINGNSEDTLAYHHYKEQGLNVIAVGGDKLSRGLTLEGLSITYYYRNTLMYDTLMQMGRWFGYRKGYMDLCRIYTSDAIAEFFVHLATAMVELRQEFDKLAEKNLSPKEYAIKMLSHPKMLLTSPMKMKNAVSSIYMYHASLQQTRSFDIDLNTFRNNMDATGKFIQGIQQPFIITEPSKSKTRYFIAENVPAINIKQFLDHYKTYRNAQVVDSAKIRDYIDLANEHKELIYWTVIVVDGNKNSDKTLNKYPVNLGTLTINNAVIRGLNRTRANDKVDLGAIVASKQEFVDLPEEKRSSMSKNELKGLRRKEHGVLLIYPLHPEIDRFKELKIPFSSDLVPIGIAFAFPSDEQGSTFDKNKVYEYNKTVRSLREQSND